MSVNLHRRDFICMFSVYLFKKSMVVCVTFPLETSSAVAVISVRPKYMLTSTFLSLPLHVSGDLTVTLPRIATPGSVVNWESGLLAEKIQK